MSRTLRPLHVASSLLPLCVVASLTACAPNPRPVTKAPAPAPGAASIVPPPAPAPKARPEGLPTKPEDGKWLTDEFGRRYFVHEVPKEEGFYYWIEEGKRVQLMRGLQLDVVRTTDTSFFVKIYDSADPNNQPVPRRGISPQDKARVEASYEVKIKESDRLEFAPFGGNLPTSGQWRQGITVTDLNGDGFLDLVHGPLRKGAPQPFILLGDGAGRFHRFAASIPPVGLDYGDVAAADFNGDGIMDLAFAIHLRGVVVLVGDGKGSYKPWSEGIELLAPDATGMPVFSSRAVQVVDWNGDGKPDLVAAGDGPRMESTTGAQSTGFRRGARGAAVYLNQGDGTWKRIYAENSDGVFGDSVTVADFNQDGRADFATSSGVQGSKKLLNLQNAEGSWSVESLSELQPAANVGAVASADFDGNGRPDLAVGASTFELGVRRTVLDVFLNQADGSWRKLVVAAAPGQNGIWSLATGDLDGDGSADLVAGTGDGDVWVFLGDGKGSFTRELSPELRYPETGCTGYETTIADFDRDGKGELIVGLAGEESVVLGNPNMPRCSTGGALRGFKASPRQPGRR